MTTTVTLKPLALREARYKTDIGLDESEPGGDWEESRPVIEELDALLPHDPPHRSMTLAMTHTAADWLAVEMENAASIAESMAEAACDDAEEKACRRRIKAYYEAGAVLTEATRMET